MGVLTELFPRCIFPLARHLHLQECQQLTYTCTEQHVQYDALSTPSAPTVHHVHGTQQTLHHQETNYRRPTNMHISFNSMSLLSIPPTCPPRPPPPLLAPWRPPQGAQVAGCHPPFQSNNRHHTHQHNNPCPNASEEATPTHIHRGHLSSKHCMHVLVR